MTSVVEATEPAPGFNQADANMATISVSVPQPQPDDDEEEDELQVQSVEIMDDSLKIGVDEDDEQPSRRCVWFGA